MRSVTLKSAITPSFMGRIATMLPGVRPSISLASLPTASTSPVVLLIATIDGSLTTIPFPLAKTNVLAVPRSMARSDENRLNRDRTFIETACELLHEDSGDSVTKPTVRNAFGANEAGLRQSNQRVPYRPEVHQFSSEKRCLARA